MRKILVLALCLILFPIAAYGQPAGHNQGMRNNIVKSSGSKTADVAIKTSPGVVYGITGYVVAGAAGVGYLVNDTDQSDSETAASQLIPFGNVASGPVDVWFPNGVIFSNGIYLNEKTGNIDVSIWYE